MFANETSVLRYFYEQKEPLNLKRLEAKFDNSERKELLDVVTELEKRNYLEDYGSALWKLTREGREYFKEEILKKSEKRYKGWTIFLTVLTILETLTIWWLQARGKK